MKKILIPVVLISLISLTAVLASSHYSNDKSDHDDDHKNARELVISGSIMPHNIYESQSITDAIIYPVEPFIVSPSFTLRTGPVPYTEYPLIVSSYMA